MKITLAYKGLVKIILCVAVVFMVTHQHGTAQTKVQDSVNVSMIHNGFSVAFVVNPKSRVLKYLYKDLLYGMRSLKQKVQIDFVNIGEATDALFTQYGVVILVNERTTDTLQPDFYAFAKKHENKKNLIVLAFLPKRKAKLSNTQGIDVISSASRERDASSLIISTVAPLCIDIFRTY